MTARARRPRLILSLDRQETEIVSQLLAAHARTLNASQLESFIVGQLRDRVNAGRARLAEPDA